MNGKRIIVPKYSNKYGEFKQANEFILNAHLSRIDLLKYNYQIVEDNSKYTIIVNNIERA